MFKKRKILRSAIRATSVCFAIFFIAWIALAQDNVFDKLQGHWIVDVDATLENIKHSPKYQAQQDEQMPQMIQAMMQRISIEIKDQEIIYYRGMMRSEQSAAMPFSVDSVDSERMVLIVSDPSGQQAFLTLIPVGLDQMNMKSTQSDDFDYFIWKRAQP